MRSRRFTKRISVYETGKASDGFGGYTTGVAVKQFDAWANLTDLNQTSKQSQEINFGIDNQKLAISVEVRLRKDFTYKPHSQYITYRGEKYTIASFPRNVNFDNSTIRFIAIKQDTKNGEG